MQPGTYRIFGGFLLLVVVVTVDSADFYGESVFDSNPDAYLTTPEIIRRYGYPVEIHTIRTEDGYLLEYHRIPGAKNKNTLARKYPIIFFHGLSSCSADSVISGPGRGLAFLLADEGYDVWLANARGNTYSRRHVQLIPSETSFWNFTFHEIGIYDVPAAIDHILYVTAAKQVIYIGHSLGTTIFYVFASCRPEYGDKILTHISVAPVAAIPHSKSVLRVLCPFAKIIKSMLDLHYKGAMVQSHDMFTAFRKYLCSKDPTNSCVQLLMFSLYGESRDQFNATLIDIMQHHIPAGTSTKNVVHAAQLISPGEFRYYDYGPAENMERYSSETPPEYNVSDIRVPVKFYYSKNDILCDPTDVEILYQQISKPMGLTLIGDEKWNHIDYLFAVEVRRYFYDPLLEFLNNVTTKSDFIASSVIEALYERNQKL